MLLILSAIPGNEMEVDIAAQAFRSLTGMRNKQETLSGAARQDSQDSHP